MSSDVPFSTGRPSKQNPNLWKWFFLIVIVLTVAATGTLWWFNQSIQLTSDELTAERERWEKHKPADYLLTYLRVSNDADTGLVYKVDVRGGKIVRAEEFAVRVRERHEVEPPEGGGKLLTEYEALQHSMDALHQEAASIMEEDAAQGRRVYVRARFHSENGGILEFVRRLMGSRERTQISVLAFRFGPDLDQ